MRLRPFDADVRAAPGPDPDDGPWLTGLLRYLRRSADLSQRQLAQRAGIPASTLGAAEAGRASLSAGRLRRVAAAAGFTLALLGPDGELVTRPRDPHQGIADAAGRRYPAHLDVHLNVRGLWWGDNRGYTVKARRPAVLVELSRRKRDNRWRRGFRYHPKQVRRRIEWWARDGAEPRPG